MNTCPVYRRSGGYSYSYFIPGPLGINLGMLASPKLYSGNVSACSLCMSCSNVCPVKIDLGEQIYLWRQQLDSLGLANPVNSSSTPSGWPTPSRKALSRCSTPPSATPACSISASGPGASERK